MIYSDIYAISDPDFTTAPLFGERRASAAKSGYTPRSEPLPAAATFARAQVSSFSTFFDIDGNLRTASADEPRISGGNILSRNLVRNPRGEGVTTGFAAVGSSTIATNWGIRAVTNATLEVLGSGVEDGIPYIDVEYIGTGTHDIEIGFESLNAIPLISLQPYACSLSVKLVAGTWDGINNANVRLRVDSPTSSSTLAFSVSGATGASLGSQRYSGTTTVAEGATNGRLQLTLNGFADASLTLRIGAPQIELGAVAGPICLPPAGVQRQSTLYAVNPARLLVEPQRTNLVANPYTPFGTGWTNTGVASVVTFTGPDGTPNSASTITETGTSAAHLSRAPNASITVGLPYTMSAIVRAGTCSTVQLFAVTAAFGSQAFANFDLAAGVLGSAGTAVTNHRMRPLGGGWWWIEITAPATSSGTESIAGIAMTATSTDARTPTYLGTARTLDVFIAWAEVGHVAETPALPPFGSPASATVGGDNITVPLSATQTNDNGGFTHLLRAVFPVGATDVTGAQTVVSLNNAALAKSIEVVNEPPRTNSVRNPLGEGATGSTAATYWSGTIPAGCAATWVRAVRNGVEGVEITLAGTTSGSTVFSINFESTPPVAASGQVWTSSFFVQELTGVAGITALSCQIAGYTAGGTAIEETSTNFFATRATFGRVSASRTMSDASTDRARAWLVSNSLSIGVNLTGYKIFVGWPQLERGPVATSILLPAAGAPAATSRAANTMTLITNGTHAVNLGAFTPGALTRVAVGTSGLGRANASVDHRDARFLETAPTTAEITTARLGSSISGARPALMEILEWAHVEHSFSEDVMRRL